MLLYEIRTMTGRLNIANEHKINTLTWPCEITKYYNIHIKHKKHRLRLTY